MTYSGGASNNVSPAPSTVVEDISIEKTFIHLTEEREEKVAVRRSKSVPVEDPNLVRSKTLMSFFLKPHVPSSPTPKLCKFNRTLTPSFLKEQLDGNHSDRSEYCPSNKDAATELNQRSSSESSLCECPQKTTVSDPVEAEKQKKCPKYKSDKGDEGEEVGVLIPPLISPMLSDRHLQRLENKNENAEVHKCIESLLCSERITQMRGRLQYYPTMPFSVPQIVTKEVLRSGHRILAPWWLVPDSIVKNTPSRKNMLDVLTDEMLCLIPRTDTGDLLSVGSICHDHGECKPCAFFQKGCCSNGTRCLFCHFIHIPSKRPRKCPTHMAGKMSKSKKLKKKAAATCTLSEPLTPCCCSEPADVTSPTYTYDGSFSNLGSPTILTCLSDSLLNAQLIPSPRREGEVIVKEGDGAKDKGEDHGEKV